MDIKMEKQENIEESKLGKIAAGIGLAATLAAGLPSCNYIERNGPQWEHEGPLSPDEKKNKVWNTHEQRGDWTNIEEGVGFCWDCYTRCAKNGGGWTVCVIFKDKSTANFILPQDCQKYLDGKKLPNCNCTENEYTTDRIDTRNLQRIGNNTTTTVFENNSKHNIKMKITESKLRNIIKEAIKEKLNEDFHARDYETVREIKKKVLECYDLAKSIDNREMMKAFESLWFAISKSKFSDREASVVNTISKGEDDEDNTINEAMSIHQDGTIFDKYNLPWNEVDTDAEERHGIWYITVDFFDYTEHLGAAEIDKQFKTLEECLEYAQNFSLEEADELCNEEITDEGFSSISLNIMCQEDNGVLREVANTRMYMPKEHSSVDFGELENKGLQDLF